MLEKEILLNLVADNNITIFVPNLVSIAEILFEKFEGPTKITLKKAIFGKLQLKLQFFLNVTCKTKDSIKWPFVHHSTPT